MLIRNRPEIDLNEFAELGPIVIAVRVCLVKFNF